MASSIKIGTIVLKNNGQDKGLGVMTEVNITAHGSQDCSGPKITLKLLSMGFIDWEAMLKVYRGRVWDKQTQ